LRLEALLRESIKGPSILRKEAKRDAQGPGD
jgi:hypothetical protein